MDKKSIALWACSIIVVAIILFLIVKPPEPEKTIDLNPNNASDKIKNDCYRQFGLQDWGTLRECAFAACETIQQNPDINQTVYDMTIECENQTIEIPNIPECDSHKRNKQHILACIKKEMVK